MAKWYGSLNNRIMEGPFKELPDIKVGDGATITMYSDRQACTVIARSASGKKLTIQRDEVTATAPGSDEYEYAPDADGAIFTARWTSEYYDRSF